MYKEFFGGPSRGGEAAMRTDKLNEITAWSAAGQKAPVCKKRVDQDPNLD